MLNMSPTVTAPFCAQTMTVRRAAGSYNEYGEWVSATASEFTVTGSFQKATELELAQMGIGEAKQEVRKLLTPTEIKVSEPDDTNSDRIIWRGKRYKAIKITDDQDYGFFRVFASYEGQES